MTSGLDVLVQAFTSGNLIVAQGLGLYAFTRYTQDVKKAAKSGGITLAAMLLGGFILWVADGLAFNTETAELGLYLLVATCSALIVRMFLPAKFSVRDGLFDSALVGLILLLGRDGVSGVNVLWASLAAGLGYLITLVVMATLRERLELAPIPKALRGVPIILITAGLLAIAIMGFRF